MSKLLSISRCKRRQRAPQALLEALATAPATRPASGTSGDNARRRPFWRLWILRLPRGRHPTAPAATTRAAGPSGGSGYCHADSQRHQRRQRAPQALLEALDTAPTTRRQPAAPAATTRAAGPSGGSGYCACHAEGSQRHQRRQRAPQALLEALDTAPATQTASGTSGDNARRSPFCRLWLLRLPRGQPAATTRAASLLEALDTAPATQKAASGDNARRRPFWKLWLLSNAGHSGYCACHAEGSQRHQRRQRAPQPLLQSLETAPATADVRCDKKGE